MAKRGSDSHEFMKKVKSEITDELRPEYKRSDFGEIVRGKYMNKIKAETNFVFFDPDVKEAFPNDEAVNKALRYLLKIAKNINQPNPTLQRTPLALRR